MRGDQINAISAQIYQIAFCKLSGYLKGIYCISEEFKMDGIVKDDFMKLNFCLPAYT